jgi:predicted PurR-regulated permease PerM
MSGNKEKSPVTNRPQYLTIAAIAAVIILAISFMVVIATTNDEIANLKNTQKELCDDDQQLASNLAAVASNLSRTFVRQIQSDKTIISALNSTKPSGYESQIGLINAQIRQDNSTMRLISSLASPTTLSTPTSPAALCSSP